LGVALGLFSIGVMGIVRESFGHALDFEIICKKCCFLILRGKNQISLLLPSPCKKIWENPLLALPGKNPPTPMIGVEC